MYKEAGKPGYRVMRARKGQRVTQPYSSGIVELYHVADAGEPGERPREALELKIRLRYEERYLGINRYYAGRQNQVNIERVIRTPRREDISTQDLARTQEGKLYRIDQVQPVLDVSPPSMDLTLCRYEQVYETPGTEEGGGDIGGLHDLGTEDKGGTSGGDKGGEP